MAVGENRPNRANWRDAPRPGIGPWNWRRRELHLGECYCASTNRSDPMPPRDAPSLLRRSTEIAQKRPRPFGEQETCPLLRPQAENLQRLDSQIAHDIPQTPTCPAGHKTRSTAGGGARAGPNGPIRRPAAAVIVPLASSQLAPSGCQITFAGEQALRDSVTEWLR